MCIHTCATVLPHSVCAVSQSVCTTVSCNSRVCVNVCTQGTKRYSLSPTCSDELGRQERETGADLRLSVKLFNKCQADYKVGG